MAGLRMGDVIKNDMAPEKGAPLLKSPTKTGMVEHEQNGVTCTERRRQNRVGQLVRARQDALDTLLRHPYLQQEPRRS